MPKTQYLALLRGINVGGKNIIKMAALKACFENMGFENVITYIQSGNVIFSATKKKAEKLINKIEKELSTKFSYKSRIVLITAETLSEIIAQAPAEFGPKLDKYRYDVMFVKEPLTAKQAIKNIPAKTGVDEIHAGKYAIYFSRLISKATQSHLPKIIKLPIYQNITVRNWNTTTKLLSLMGKTG